MLAVLLLAAVLVRLWLLPGRWINPDEGAHLMDGLLLLEGFVPGVDFVSRQPFYVAVLALFVGVLGTSYELVRLYPVLATVGTGLFVYLIAARLLDRRTALLAAGLYLFLPFTVLFGTHVKTEPLAAVLGAAALYLMLVGLDARRSGGQPAAPRPAEGAEGVAAPAPGARRGRAFLALAGAGALMAFAYYSRQSSLAVLATALVAIPVLAVRDTARDRAGAGAAARARGAAAALGALALGFALVCVAVMALYTRWMPPSAVFLADLNPAVFVWENVSEVLPPYEAEDAGAAAAPNAAEQGPTIDRQDQPWSVTVRNVRQTLRLNSLLLLGALLSPLALLRGAGRLARPRRGGAESALVLWSWLGFLALAYGLWILRRGFFPAYLVDLLAPLAILTAASAVDAAARLREAAPGWRDVGRFAVPVGAFVGLHLALGPAAINRPLYYVAAVLALGVLYLGAPRGLARWGIVTLAAAVAATGAILAAQQVGGAVRLALYLGLLGAALGGTAWAAGVRPRRPGGRVAGLVLSALLVGTAGMWLGESQERLDRRFDGVWSPQAVAEVAAFLDVATEPGDEVLSGAVIWEFEAGRRPFMMISHPLGLRGGGLASTSRIWERLSSRPPAVAVLDGYAEMTYGRRDPAIIEWIEERYVLQREVGPAYYPVRIYAHPSLAAAASLP